jgi:DNA mismatch repair protein MutL
MAIEETARRIRILRADVSRKIAAGEVIDRPFSIVREAMDNSLDAHAGSIDVFLEAGGLERIRIADDGDGIRSEDLALCGEAHATSKIVSENDLLSVRSLGFRGEALSSIAACARLEIVSATEDGKAMRLLVQGGKRLALEPSQGRQGTVIDVSELFYNYPARRKFLKSASAETSLCRSAFLDHAVAFPQTAFRLFTDGKLKLFFPAGAHLQRVAQAYGEGESLPMSVLEAAGEGFSFLLAAGDPGVTRKDRKLLQIFVNGRRVWEFSLVQAIGYGYSGSMPGGSFPVAFLFLSVDPHLVDFNIHPAKKEVRIRILAEIRRAVLDALRAHLERIVPIPRREHDPPRPEGSLGFRPAAPEIRPPVLRSEPTDSDLPFRFLGQAFGVFLIVEHGDRLLFLDQHAAHERIRFDRILASQPVVQELLFPIVFDASDEEATRIRAWAPRLKENGIGLLASGRLTFEVTNLRQDFLAMGESVLTDTLKRFHGSEEMLVREMAARAACHGAIKEGEVLDGETARRLIADALRLPEPRCPHGRPIWAEIGKDFLHQEVGRA